MSIILHESLVIPDGKTAKKFQNVSDSLSSYQVVVNEATGIVEETKTPAGQEATGLQHVHKESSLALPVLPESN